MIVKVPGAITAGLLLAGCAAQQDSRGPEDRMPEASEQEPAASGSSSPDSGTRPVGEPSGPGDDAFECLRDSDCETDFCNAGKCLVAGSARGELGAECDGRVVPKRSNLDAAAHQCGPFVCLDDRCRTCESSAQCQEFMGAPWCGSRDETDSYGCGATPAGCDATCQAGEHEGPVEEASANREARAQALEDYLERRLGDSVVLATTTLPSGDIVDWLDPSTVAGSEAVPPPSSLSSQAGSSAAELVTSELEAHPELWGPEGSLPVVRPRFEPFLEERNYGLGLEAFLFNLDPAGVGVDLSAGALVAGYVDERAVSGASVRFPVWASAFEQADFDGYVSVSHVVALSCPDPAPSSITGHEWIAAGYHQFPRKNGDDVPRFLVEYSNGAWGTWLQGGHADVMGGWVPYAGSLWQPGVQIEESSSQGGLVRRLDVEVVFSADSGWWVGVNGAWVGHIPVDTSTGGVPFEMLSVGACATRVFGQVRNHFAWLPSTNADLGSGLSPEGCDSVGPEGPCEKKGTRVASASDLWVLTQDGVAEPFAGTPLETNKQCYGVSPTHSNEFGASFYYGGPGADGPGCESTE